MDFGTQALGQINPENLPRKSSPNSIALLFSTRHNARGMAWHGMSRPLVQPECIYRKSIAIYYLCEPSNNADPRGRALFAPREEQRGNLEIEELIRLRSGINTSSSVYKK